jgi:hypothetical protein
MGKLVGRVSEGWDALLNVKDQILPAQGPIALRVLRGELLGQSESVIFRFL